MSSQSSNKSRSTLEDAIVEYAQASVDNEVEMTKYTKDWVGEAWQAMLEAIDEHEEVLYKEAYKDGREEAFNHQVAQEEMNGS